MKVKHVSQLLLIVFLFAGCEDNDFNLAENNFFPLQVGNYWELHATNQDPLSDQVVVKKEITTTRSFSGVTYYLMVITTEHPGGIYIDTTYYRLNKKNGFVYQRSKTGEITNPYRLDATDGARWSSSFASNEKDMRVDYYPGPIEISSTYFTGCRVFSYNVEELIDEEYWTTLAPDIGIVTTNSAWGFRRDLKKAIINGVEYNF